MSERFMSSRRFVLLDRDGTLIEERHYLFDPDGVRLIPGAMDALRDFKALGFGLVVITNQAGLGREFLIGFNLMRFTGA